MLRLEVTYLPKYAHFRQGGKGIFDTFDNSICIYYPNIKNSLNLFLTYFHEILHYMSWKLGHGYERIIWFLLDYRKWYIKKRKHFYSP